MSAAKFRNDGSEAPMKVASEHVTKFELTKTISSRLKKSKKAVAHVPQTSQEQLPLPTHRIVMPEIIPRVGAVADCSRVKHIGAYRHRYANSGGMLGALTNDFARSGLRLVCTMCSTIAIGMSHIATTTSSIWASSM